MANILVLLLIGLIAGWLAGQFVKGSGFGVVGDIIIGIVGAVLGGFLFGLLNITSYGLIGDVVVATIGAIRLLYIVSMVKRPAV